MYQSISASGIFYTCLLLLIPLAGTMFLGLKLHREILYSMGRMALQLSLLGIYLKFLFSYDQWWLNVLWVLFMILVASITAIRHSKLNVKKFLMPVMLSGVLCHAFVIIYFNRLILDLTAIFHAKYLVVVSGMLLGNILRKQVIALSSFFSDLIQHENAYHYQLSLGASPALAVKPLFKKAIRAALRPSLAVSATMGIVSIPGMMTGQILGGTDPANAVKYQVAIMIAIFTSSFLNVSLTLLFSLRCAFDSYGRINISEIMKNSKVKMN